MNTKADQMLCLHYLMMAEIQMGCALSSGVAEVSVAPVEEELEGKNSSEENKIEK